MFNYLTSEKGRLTKYFDNEKEFSVQFLQWERELQRILSRCFKKVRLRPKTRRIFRNKSHHLIVKRLKAQNNHDEAEVDKIEEMIKENEAKKNKEELIKNLELIKSEGSKGVWKVKQKYFPKKLPAAPVAKKNEEGQIITNIHELKQLYLNHFINRMRNRKMVPSLQSYEEEPMKNLVKF